ncbi:uncharacterized protein UV8b_05757 [Ustilaginoidea virens]|uniref:Uncharacterized protein n=1 Tax=Ustilaginoidea virens TaxID=1159556 RepID=A0A063CA19_USTVR|nr:uncharacterized protein UV8b_05757 [Ustilaginoidea virens]QUC21514.1 hypothetical protein UV8b_05757 [Ustilaginoidea virens]GAO13491.1 hypothetical protein UVI_02016320 [Ustilaginoidea virens]
MTNEEEPASPSASAPASASALSQNQIAAIFDVLVHHETYAEITSFTGPDAISSYGFPFKTTKKIKSTKKTATLPTTPSTTAPSTPRARTPVSFFTSSSDVARQPSAAVVRAQHADGPEEGQGEGEGEGEDLDEGRRKGGDGDDNSQMASAAPILQLLLARVVLPLPGVSSLPRDFWSVRIQNLLARLGEADLSESYDKGALGTRKVLATGASALIEMIGRGLLGGVDKTDSSAATKSSYNLADADDLEAAWGEVMQGLVYGDLVNQLFRHFVESDDLEKLSPTVEASARHNIFHIATLVHQIFVLSPEGQYLLKLMDNVHSLVPYKMMKQTLRIGNPAIMIRGMMRILLAKLSVTSVTNWLGLTQNADDGMNLLQRIISLVLSWDAGEFRKVAERVERAKDGPSDGMLRTIRCHVEGARSEHEAARLASKENSQSIITSIFNASSPALNEGLTESQHQQCLEYYSALLSVRDRDRIALAICREPPDMFTQAIKDAVDAYEPIIRAIHSNIDLGEHFEAVQGFIDEFIGISKPKRGPPASGSGPGPGSPGERAASVEDYVQLLERNRGLLYRWIHALASQCPGLWEELRIWSNSVVVKFRKRRLDEAAPVSSGADKTMPAILTRLVDGLDAKTQTSVLEAADAHAAYLATLSSDSHARMRCLAAVSPGLPPGTTSAGGPGVYLSRWQALLDETPITPSKPRGPPRCGKDVKHTTAQGKTGVGGGKLEAEGAAPTTEVAAPNVMVIVDALGGAFRREIQELARLI